jgi:hypothetical protein
MQVALSIQLLSMACQIIVCPIGDLNLTINILWGFWKSVHVGHLDEIDSSTPLFLIQEENLPTSKPASPINSPLDLSELS